MLFKDLNTLQIVERSHKFNAEFLDNLLEMIQDSDICLYLQHTANTDFSYTVVIKEENYSDILWDKYSKTLLQDKKLFYTIILKKDLQEYLQINKYQYVEIFNLKEKNKAIQPNINLPPKPTQEIPVTGISFSEPKLKRTTETSIRTFFHR